MSTEEAGKDLASSLTADTNMPDKSTSTPQDTSSLLLDL